MDVNRTGNKAVCDLETYSVYVLTWGLTLRVVAHVALRVDFYSQVFFHRLEDLHNQSRASSGARFKV